MNAGFNSPILIASLMLAASNIFMTFAWCAHLKKSVGETLVDNGAAELGYCLV